MIPRFAVFLIPLLLFGCGLELLSPLQKLNTSDSSKGFEYSWPVDVALPLGSLSLSLDDPEVARSVFGDLSVLPGDDERLRLHPVAKEIAPIAFGDALELKDPLSLVLPAQTLPDLNLDLPDFTFPRLDLSTDQVAGAPLPPGLPIPYAIPYTTTVPLNMPVSESEFSEAQLGDPAGHFEFEIENRMGVRMTPSVKLYAKRQGATREIGRTQAALPLEVGQSRKLVIPLYADAFLTRDLSLKLDIQVMGGQQVQAPSTGLSLDAIKLVKGKVRFMRAEVPAKSFDVPVVEQPLALPEADFPADAVKSLEVEKGTLQLTLVNTFPVAATFEVDFLSFYRSGQLEPMKGTYPVRAGETRTFALPLAGVSIRPHQGRIQLKATGMTSGTGAAGALFALDGSQSLSGTMVLLAPLSFKSVEVPIRREVQLPATVTPLQMPAFLADHGIQLEDVILRLYLLNRSGLGADVALDVSAKLPAGPAMGLTDKAGQPIALTLSPNQAQDFQINAANSNLLELLNAKPTELTLGGKVTVDSKGQAVRISSTDKLEGRLSVEIPLTVTFPALGKDSGAPAITVRPPISLPFAGDSGAQLKMVERAVLTVAVNNGWNVPLDLELLFSAQSDPFADADAFRHTIALGNPHEGYQVKNELVLEGESLDRFRAAKLLGLRVTSQGSGTPVTLFRGSAFRVDLGVTFKANVSSSQGRP
jgi:hypothetical protein